jgi:hypothetical protein
VFEMTAENIFLLKIVGGLGVCAIIAFFACRRKD